MKTLESLREDIQIHETVVVKFGSRTCGPCLALKPTVESLSEELDDEVRFLDVDIDEVEGAAAEYGVTAVPTMLIFHIGKLEGRIIGAQPKSKIRVKLEAFIS